ncbi:disulfide bond formation protein B [Sphingomonas bacterium]|uniref:disulfide bond formation protein B n=1 Tax=Sphingomonas bacterium TaxID=1895847 RepID=UPI0015750C6A|nr:disulfide bond formation protein B [Sphingomonas bacterium]
MTPSLAQARLLALLIPAALLAGAWGSQLIGHLYPCEMCHWQRWPHYAALVAALAAFALPVEARGLTLLAAVLIAGSGAIGVYHAGVEWGWWHGVTACTQTATFAGSSADDRLAALLRAPMIRCDVAQWRLAGVSLAGWNALVSLVGAGAVIFLAEKRA